MSELTNPRAALHATLAIGGIVAIVGTNGASATWLTLPTIYAAWAGNRSMGMLVGCLATAGNLYAGYAAPPALGWFAIYLCLASVVAVVETATRPPAETTSA